MGRSMLLKNEISNPRYLDSTERVCTSWHGGLLVYMMEIHFVYTWRASFVIFLLISRKKTLVDIWDHDLIPKVASPENCWAARGCGFLRNLGSCRGISSGPLPRIPPSYGGNNSVLGTFFHFFKLFHVVGVVLTLIGEEVNLLQDETFPRAKCEEEFSMEQ